MNEATKPELLSAEDRAPAAAFAGPFTEAELVEADLAYLAGQAERDRRRVAEAHALDLQRLRAQGVL